MTLENRSLGLPEQYIGDKQLLEQVQLHNSHVLRPANPQTGAH